MTLEEQLFSLLSPLASGGCWPLIAAQGTAAPYITYQSVISTTNNTLRGASDTQNTRMQIKAYASTYVAAKALGKSIDAALAGAAFTNIKLTDQMLPEPDVKLFCAMLDYSIWSKN